MVVLHVWWQNLLFQTYPTNINDYGCCLHLGLLTSSYFCSKWPALTSPPQNLSCSSICSKPSGSSWARWQERCPGCDRPSFWTKNLWSSSFIWGVLWDLIMMLEQFWRIREGVVWDLNFRQEHSLQQQCLLHHHPPQWHPDHHYPHHLFPPQSLKLKDLHSLTNHKGPLCSLHSSTNLPTTSILQDPNLINTLHPSIMFDKDIGSLSLHTTSMQVSQLTWLGDLVHHLEQLENYNIMRSIC